LSVVKAKSNYQDLEYIDYKLRVFIVIVS